MTRQLLHFAPWLVALVVLSTILTLVFRKRLKRLTRLAKACATDKRLPRSVRWLFIAGLAAKALPVDFGIDEFCLGLGIILLVTLHRETWAQIRSEIE
jgi:hypothetical protein